MNPYMPIWYMPTIRALYRLYPYTNIVNPCVVNDPYNHKQGLYPYKMNPYMVYEGAGRSPTTALRGMRQPRKRDRHMLQLLYQTYTLLTLDALNPLNPLSLDPKP